jgi:hypothetical protein
LEIDHTLPTIPELVIKEFPDIRILIVLRDPVKRAISSYKLYLRRIHMSPLLGIKRTAERRPRLRLVEYGHYGRYIKVWRRFVPLERMHILVFEEDVVKWPEKSLETVYGFLDLDKGFKPDSPRDRIHGSMGWTRLLIRYYTWRFSKLANQWIHQRPIAGLLDSLDPVFEPRIVKDGDIEFLRTIYLPEKDELRDLLGRKLDCWTYAR